jgi:hypothetical protein
MYADVRAGKDEHRRVPLWIVSDFEIFVNDPARA